MFVCVLCVFLFWLVLMFSFRFYISHCVVFVLLCLVFAAPVVPFSSYGVPRVVLTRVEAHSRFRHKLLVIRVNLSAKRDCGSERIKITPAIF